MGLELFLEIGCEEIPARFLEKGLADLSRLITKLLDDLGLSYGKVRTAGTPRRMMLGIADVQERQEDKVIERIGPSKAVAFDADGNPTKAAIGFAKGQGLGVGDLTVISTDKGQYIALKKHEAGMDTRILLAKNLPDLILALPWPKSMRWAELSNRFVRPVHWIVAQLGGKVVEFSLFNLKTDNRTRGHRFLAPDRLDVKDFDGCINALRGSSVIALIDERREIIGNELLRIGREVGGKVVADPWLVNHVANLVEFPVALVGTIDQNYLGLPREVLVTTLRDHQKYFVIEDENGQLLPHFVTISNMLVPDPSVVVKGNERVLAARLEDARFYFREDLKKPLATMAQGLSGVLFQADLGTYAEKTDRVITLVDSLAASLAPEKADMAHRAASLAKADLVSGMVGQFPELQGIMGMHYATSQHEPEELALAIAEHYLPKGQGAQLPGTDTGALVALADKFDTICACFGVGLAPTGSGDPFALRRAALGIIHILADRNWSINLEQTISLGVETVWDKIAAKDPTCDKGELTGCILEFFRQRLANMLKADGLPTSTVDAVLAVRFQDLVETRNRAQALAAFARQDQWEPFSVAFKRVANILATATDDFAGATVDESLFEDDAERKLWSAVAGVSQKVTDQVSRGELLEAFTTIASIREQVDRFFDDVLVMHDDARLRVNRLALLYRIGLWFTDIADFKKL